MSNLVDCACSDYCNCEEEEERLRCELCEYFKPIDSGYGYCMVLPTIVTVPWCRVICGQFKRRRKRR